MTGIMVAPGLSASTFSYYFIRKGYISNKYYTHLCSPPPFSCVHIVIQSSSLVGIRVVPLGFVDQICRELRVTDESLDAGEGVAIVHVQSLASDEDLFASEPWSGRRELVDKLVQLASVLEE